MLGLTNVVILGDAAQIGTAETIARAVVFLILLALGGYFLVLLHRRGHFSGGTSLAKRGSKDEIRIVAVRFLNGRKYLAVVEHLGKRFLLAMSGDRIDKISEWDTEREC